MRCFALAPVAGTVLVLAGYAGAWPGPIFCPPESNAHAFKQAKQQPPAYYFLGRSFERLPLLDVSLGPAGRPMFGYGSADPGSTRPISIQNFLLRDRHPRKFASFRCTRLTLRGVPAADYLASDGALEIYAGKRVIVIWAHRAAQARRAARSLRRVDGSAASGPLPQPPASVSRALRHCLS